MARFDTLRSTVRATVRSNGNQDIQGQNMQNVLLSMITAMEAEFDSLGLDFYAISQSEYDALQDKSGIHFVYPG